MHDGRLCNDTIYLHGSGDRLLEVILRAWLIETVHQDNLLDADSRQIIKVCSAAVSMMVGFSLGVGFSQRSPVMLSRCVTMRGTGN